MGKAKPAPTLIDKVRYQRAAEEYLAGLTMENLMEATGQATQRKITLESMDLVRAARPEVQTFNELLIQYPKKGAGKRNVAGVVPDNMIVVHPEPLDPGGSYDVPWHPVGPLVVMEYVSHHNRRKDYDRNMTLYEADLKIPYYLIFYHEDQELNLYQRKRGRYSSVPLNAAGRQAIPELELEVGLLDRWVRYWFRGKLLPLPGEMARELEQAQKRATDAEAEIVRLREELEQLRGNAPR